MAFIVSFSGSHGVGKTSLVDSISQFLSASFQENQDYKIFKEINTGLFNIGLALNGNGFDFDEVMFSQKQAFYLGYNILKYYGTKEADKRVIFTDRSCIDTYMYTKYFVAKLVDNQDKKKYDSLLKDMAEKSEDILKHIHTILIAPFNDFEVLQDRMSIQSRDEVWQEFLTYFDLMASKQCMFYKTDTQTTEDRCKEVMDILNPHFGKNSNNPIMFT